MGTMIESLENAKSAEIGERLRDLLNLPNPGPFLVAAMLGCYRVHKSYMENHMENNKLAWKAFCLNNAESQL